MGGLFEKVVFKEAFGRSGFMIQMEELVEVRQCDRVAWSILASEEHSLDIWPLQERGIVAESAWKEPFENLQKARVTFHSLLHMNQQHAADRW